MELLELTPPDFGVERSGIYVLDDNGTLVLAGPFSDEAAALTWIEQTRAERSTRSLSAL
jgi:hypothetical protein